MATGIIGTISGAGSLSYTPINPAKLNISIAISNTTTVTLNGTAILASASVGVYEVTHYVGAGQTVSITSGGSGAAVVVSALEGQ